MEPQHYRVTKESLVSIIITKDEQDDGHWITPHTPHSSLQIIAITTSNLLDDSLPTVDEIPAQFMGNSHIH